MSLRPPAIVERDMARLAPLWPDLRLVLLTTLDAMDRLGFPMCVTAGARTQAEQVALWQQGRRLDPATNLWVPIDPVHKTGIVTNADGILKPSNHQLRLVNGSPFGFAGDCAFLFDGPDQDTELDDVTWDEHRPWALYGEHILALGKGKAIWGGQWAALRDAPHAEWRA